MDFKILSTELPILSCQDNWTEFKFMTTEFEILSNYLDRTSSLKCDINFAKTSILLINVYHLWDNAQKLISLNCNRSTQRVYPSTKTQCLKYCL